MIVVNVTTFEKRFQIPIDLVEQFLRADDGTEKGMILGCFDTCDVPEFKLTYSDGKSKKNGNHASISESLDDVEHPSGFYDFYIHSKKWQQKRVERLRLDDFKCKRCGSAKNVQVHHTNYKRVGMEDVDNDLVTLCRKCHAEIHGVEDEEVLTYR